MIYVILSSVILAYLVGRSPIKCFETIHFRYPVLLIGALMLQFILFYLFKINPIRNMYLLELSVLILLAGLWLNRNLPGIIWFMFGSLLNFLAIVIHHGRMPVSEAALKIAHIPYSPDDSRHMWMTDTYFWWLGDWIPIYKKVISIGDILVGIGVVMFILKNSPLRRKNETEK